MFPAMKRKIFHKFHSISLVILEFWRNRQNIRNPGPNLINLTWIPDISMITLKFQDDGVIYISLFSL